MRPALCRVDAGPARGLGHLQRCLSLAEALGRRDIRTLFAAPDVGDSRRRIESAGFRLVCTDVDWTRTGSVEDRRGVIDAARAHGCGIIIVDSYDIDADYVAALRRTGALIVAFDDLAAVRTSAHVVVNGAAGAETLAYEPATPDTRILAGASYALLHKAFWNVPARHVARIATRVLVAVGGADPCRALPRIVHALDVVSERIETTAVIGPFFPRDRSELLPERYVHRVRFVDTPDDLLQLMLDADIAVSAGGQTLYELAATGTPAVAVEVASNQGFQIRGLAAAGVVFDAGQLSDRDFDARLSTAVERLLSDVAAREKMSVCGRRLVDGRGAARVAAAIASLL